ncbi:MAG TPA: SRPBCC domain-containing protein [Solirubrobacteraceae bacterium]|jgi:hypothetical protein
MPLHLETTIDVVAPPDAVWAVLVDLPAYADWNPFITRAGGRPAAGERLTLKLQQAKGRGLTIRPKVLVAEPGRELCWLGHLLIPGIFDGRHRFTIRPIDGGCRLVQEEHFTGLLVPILSNGLRSGTQPAFQAMNAALKRRVETASVSS